AIADWICNGFPQLYKYDEAYALALFDDYLTKMSNFPLTAENPSRKPLAPNKIRSQKTYMSAPEGIAKSAMEGLLTALKDKDVQPGGTISSDIALRMRKILNTTDEGSDASWCLLTRYLPW